MSLDEFNGELTNPIRPNYSKPWGVRGKIAPQTTINHAKLNETILALVQYHVPAPAKILDPTCGVKDYQFSHYWWKKQELYEITRNDLKDTKLQTVRSSLYNLPFREAFDGIVYDPPFILYTSTDNDKRAAQYGQDLLLTRAAIYAFYESWLTKVSLAHSSRAVSS